MLIYGLFQRASGNHQETPDERLTRRGIRTFKIVMLGYCGKKAEYSTEDFAEKLIQLGMADSDNKLKIAHDLKDRLVDYKGKPLIIGERINEQGSVTGYSFAIRKYADRDLMRFN